MCRLFGLLATQPESAEPWLVRSDRSLLAQSNHSPEEAQRDGWGIAWVLALRTEPDREGHRRGL